ncbi:hypothetical protein R3Q16_34960 [Rhodococcus globerulus]|uniref:Transposase n=1 Tax=Rhodococcus globerulus TaxID=33008 RepID=A0ABU4C5K6_RHOGO|nr:hypothetical protein [Rhodococcus globerulus]MDV6271787.1 hypothetical protein [Rhodococcus globerulus]
MNATLADRGTGKTTSTVTDTAAAQAGAVDTAAQWSAVAAELASILTELIRIVSAGGTVTLDSIPDELTTKRGEHARHLPPHPDEAHPLRGYTSPHGRLPYQSRGQRCTGIPRTDA